MSTGTLSVYPNVQQWRNGREGRELTNTLCHDEREGEHHTGIGAQANYTATGRFPPGAGGAKKDLDRHGQPCKMG